MHNRHYSIWPLICLCTISIVVAINIYFDRICCAKDHAFIHTCSFSSRFECCSNGWAVCHAWVWVAVEF